MSNELSIIDNTVFSDKELDAINKNIVWNSWGTNYKYAKFGANIILSESEQEQQTEIKTERVKQITIKE